MANGDSSELARARFPGHWPQTTIQQKSRAASDLVEGLAAVPGGWVLLVGRAVGEEVRRRIGVVTGFEEQSECRTAGNGSQHAVQCEATVVRQRPLADETYALTLDCPQVARRILPGQFFMIRPVGGSDPLLGRPFALYDVRKVDENGDAQQIEFVYHVVGSLTGTMPHWTGGEKVVVWGPLGNGFPEPAGDHLLCVGGGIGYTPFLAVAREALGQGRYGDPRRVPTAKARRVTLCYGTQSRRFRADLSDFEELDSLEIQLSTDDGSEGHHGFVTDLVAKSLSQPSGERPDRVFCCGPEPMMHAVARLCDAAGVPCWLSLETPMACGFGACFSCVTRVKTGDGEWDYRRTCVEGPVFEGSALAIDPPLANDVAQQTACGSDSAK